ncbi:MAG: DHHA1 domain-containing protein [Blastocatellia bacterium]
MQTTERLYFTDSSLLQFPATIIDVRATERGYEVQLDRTAFYPTGGGQPNDTGLLGDARVIDVFENDDGVIYHVVSQLGALAPGQSVEGRIDRARRLDHLQQHSGQHILSQAFVHACRAETRSFHLGAQSSTIDIELQTPTSEQMHAAEEIANEIIFEDRPMRVHLLSEEEAQRLPLRKETPLRGQIRVIEVEGYDYSPCGGTHAARAGQIGLIAIKGFERAKKMTRVEFVCGHRALEEYRAANSIAATVAQLFSAERDASVELVRRAIQENKSLKRRIRDLLELAMTAEAAEMSAQATSTGQFKIIQATFDGRDLEEVRMLATKIVQAEPAIALLGTKDAGAARLIFARSASLTENMGQLLAEACQVLGGRGGGKPDMAQGGGPDVAKLDEAIKLAAEKIQNQ